MYIIVDRDKFHAQVHKKLLAVESVLDIGPGICPQRWISTQLHICAEPFEGYAQKLRKTRRFGSIFLVLEKTWQQVVDIFDVGTVDSIILVDVIEHLEKDEAKRLLSKTELIAKKQVVIFTPYGFLPQEVPPGFKDAWGMDGAEWQRHKSGWTEIDFSPQWEIYVCPEYHFSDAITGETFEKPYGAMFAILTKQYETEQISFGSLRRRMMRFISGSIPHFIRANLYPAFLKRLYRDKILVQLRKL